MSSFDLVWLWHKQIKKYYCQCEIKVQGREDASVFCGKLRLSSTPARCLFLCLSVHHMCPPSHSHSHSHPIPPSLHLFTKACLLQFCVRRGEGSLEVRLPRANAPALSDYFAADSTCSLWYKGSHEIRSNSKTSRSWLTKSQWTSAELVLASHSALLPLARHRVWRMGGMCELWELWGRANFKRPYIMCPLPDSSASFGKWQRLSTSASRSLSHTHTTLSLFKPHSKNYFLIFTPSPSSLALSLICFISLYLAFIPASLFPSLSPPYLSLDTDW